MKKGIIYIFISNLISLLATLGTGFLLPKFLSIDSYSEIKTFQLYLTYVGILHLGFADGIYLKNGGKSLKTIDQATISSEYRTFKIFQLIVSLLLAIFSFATENYLLFFCALTVLPINASSFLKSLYQSIGEFKQYSKFTNLNTLLIFAINLILLFILKSQNALAFIILYIVAYFLYWFVIEFHHHHLFDRTNPSANPKYLIKNIRSGFFLMTGNFCSIILTSIDRLFVQNFISRTTFAYYSFAVSIENLLTIFITPISTVLYNYFCTHHQASEIQKIKRLILLFSSLLIAGFFPAKLAVKFFLPNFTPSLTVLSILFAAQFFSIIVRCIHVNLYKSAQAQTTYFKKLLSIIFLSIALNSAAVLIFKSSESIAIATLISNFAWFIISELDFKTHFLKLRDYLFMSLTLINFLITSNLNLLLSVNPITSTSPLESTISSAPSNLSSITSSLHLASSPTLTIISLLLYLFLLLAFTILFERDLFHFKFKSFFQNLFKKS